MRRASLEQAVLQPSVYVLDDAPPLGDRVARCQGKSTCCTNQSTKLCRRCRVGSRRLYRKRIQFSVQSEQTMICRIYLKPAANNVIGEGFFYSNQNRKMNLHSLRCAKCYCLCYRTQCGRLTTHIIWYPGFGLNLPSCRSSIVLLSSECRMPRRHLHKPHLLLLT